MKKNLVLCILTIFLLLYAGSVQSANEIVIDNISPAINGDTLNAGVTYTFNFRFTYETGSNFLGGQSNGFIVYEKNGGNFIPVSGDTLLNGWSFSLFGVSLFGVDGIGYDTIGFGGIEFGTTGFPVGFDDYAWYVETGGLNANDTICIDSVFYPPGGAWLWVISSGGGNIVPDWAGPYCYAVDPFTDVELDYESGLPTSYSLSQNYPNPFNPTTEIKFDIPTRSQTTLKVFNVLGQEVERLVDKEMSPGRYVAEWDASEYSSGIYFYKLESENFVDTKKMVLVK
jgi:type IX secretion system substrate protein